MVVALGCMVPLAASCGSSTSSTAVKGPVARGGGPSGAGDRGVADDDTWMTLATHGARMRVPAGWSYEAKADSLTAQPNDKKAAIVLTGAATKADFEAKVRSIGVDYNVEKVDFGKPKPGKLHGIDVVMYEDMVAVSNGQPADVFVMLGEAPNGTGVIVLFIMAWDGTQVHDQNIIDAANSLRPL